MRGVAWPGLIRVAAVLAVYAVGASCSARSDMPQGQVSAPQGVPPEKVILMGRIELYPPLQQGEQVLRTAKGEQLRNTFILYCGDRPRDLTGIAPDDFTGAYSTILDREFYIKVDRSPVLYCAGGIYFTVFDPPARVEHHVLNFPFRIDLKQDDAAVYIGTLQLHRQGGGVLRTVLVRDDFQWAENAYRELFGQRKAIRKALVSGRP